MIEQNWPGYYNIFIKTFEILHKKAPWNEPPKLNFVPKWGPINSSQINIIIYSRLISAQQSHRKLMVRRAIAP